MSPTPPNASSPTANGYPQLSQKAAHHIRRLLYQNLDRLFSIIGQPVDTQIQLITHDLHNFLQRLYPDPSELATVIASLEHLVTLHQDCYGQEVIQRQAAVELEQQVFGLLGFEEQKTTTQVKILIVDDTPDNLRLLSSALVQQGYDVRSAISGSMALNVVQNILPNLILLDIMMPGMNGYEVCERLKANEKTRDCPVIFISAINDPLDKVRAFRVGGVDYIPKPFQIEEVLVRVEHHLRFHYLQRRLEDQNVRLQQEVQERRQAEENALKALEKEKEFSELQSRFVSMVSHEFRTPLTMIQSSAELLEYYEWPEEEKKERLHQIQYAVQHMTQLMEDVLLLGRTESEVWLLSPVQFEVVQFCRMLTTDIQLTLGSQSQIQFISSTDAQEMWLDQKIIRHIVYNLLSNAIKYSPEDSPITVELTASYRDFILKVSDRGIGIPEAEQSKIFNSFYRAANSGTIAGTGLGLAIVKKCVDLHGGEIRFESTPNVGTTFTVRLPNQVASDSG